MNDIWFAGESSLFPVGLVRKLKSPLDQIHIRLRDPGLHGLSQGAKTRDDLQAINRLFQLQHGFFNRFRPDLRHWKVRLFEFSDSINNKNADSSSSYQTPC